MTIDATPIKKDSNRFPRQIFRSVKDLNRVKRLMLFLPVQRLAGQPPWGYQWSEETQQLEPMEDKALIILRARKYLETCSYAEVAAWVTKQCPDHTITHNGLWKLMRDRMPAEEIIVKNIDGSYGITSREHREQLFSTTTI